MTNYIVDSVLEIINSYLQNVEITQQQFTENLTKLGMDSITFIQIIVALEDKFKCEIPDSKLLITEMDTIEKITNVLGSIIG